MVNVNPTNIRPQSDTPEIRKYKKKFNTEVLCAGLWGLLFSIACFIQYASGDRCSLCVYIWEMNERREEKCSDKYFSKVMMNK